MAEIRSWSLRVVFKNNDSLRGAKTVQNVLIDILDIDSPSLTAAYDYWDNVRGEKFAPSLKEFKLEALPRPSFHAQPWLISKDRHLITDTGFLALRWCALREWN